MRLLLLALGSLLAAPAARAQAAGPPVRAARHADVRAQVVARPYTVEGRSEADLLRAMLAAGPEHEGRRFFGLTRSEVQFAYARVTGPRGCALREPVVTARISVTLPQWTPPPGATFALERDWRRFERALAGHENGHRQLAEEEAAALRRALVGLRARSCDALDAEARRRAEAVRARYLAAHADYDASTRHGATQGANWPVR